MTREGAMRTLCLCGDFSYGAHQLVQVLDGCVNVGSYADATYVFPDDADGVNLVLVEECVLQLRGSHAIDAHSADGAGVSEVQRGVQFDLGDALHPGGPVVFQVADARFLALAANSLVKVDCLANPLFQCEASRAQGFKLANVGAVRSGVADQRPNLLDLRSEER